VLHRKSKALPAPCIHDGGRESRRLPS